MNYNSAIASVLKELGVREYLTGYDYIETAVRLRVTNTIQKCYGAMQLYYAVAKEHNTSYKAVERAIRYAIECALTVQIRKCSIGGLEIHCRKERAKQQTDSLLNRSRKQSSRRMTMEQNEVKYAGMKNEKILRELDVLIETECRRGVEKNGPHHSRHEALAVLEEELFEAERELERMKYVFVLLKESVFCDCGALKIRKMLREIEQAATNGMLEMMQAGAMIRKFDLYMQTEES